MSRTKTHISGTAGAADELEALLELLAPDRAPGLQPYGNKNDKPETCLSKEPDEELQNLPSVPQCA